MKLKAIIKQKGKIKFILTDYSMIIRGKVVERVVEEKGGQYMVIEDDLTLSGEHIMQYTNLIS